MKQTKSFWTSLSQIKAASSLSFVNEIPVIWADISVNRLKFWKIEHALLIVFIELNKIPFSVLFSKVFRSGIKKINFDSINVKIWKESKTLENGTD